MSKAITAGVLHNYESSYRPSIIWVVLWGIIALIAANLTLMNIDDAWLLQAAERMHGGAIPYLDFLEVNPPLILWIYLIPVYISHLLGMGAMPVFTVFIVALSGFSLWLTLYEIKRHPLLAEPCYGNIVFAALAQAVLGCSFLIFGQREHLFFLLALPFFVQSSYQEQEPKKDFRQLLIAVMAGLGLAIKPYFIIIWLAGEIFSASNQHNYSLLFRRTNWLIGGTMLLYFIAAAVFAPHYFDHIFPIVLHTYNAFTAGSKGLSVQLFILSLLYLLPVCLIKLDKRQLLFAGKISCWFLASVMTVAVQHKGWLNHYFPALAFGSFLFSSLLAIVIHQWSQGSFPLNRKNFALLWALGFVTFGLPAYHLVSTRRAQDFQLDYIHKLGGFVADTHSAGKALYVMSFGADFPAANILPVTFPFHFYCLWTLPAIINAEKAGKIEEPLAKVRDFTIRTVTEDFSAFKPALVVVDDNKAMTGLFKDFDFIDYFRHDAVFRAEWDHYRKAGEIAVDGKDSGRTDGHYTVYSRIIGDNL